MSGVVSEQTKDEIGALLGDLRFVFDQMYRRDFEDSECDELAAAFDRLNPGVVRHFGLNVAEIIRDWRNAASAS